MATHVWKGDLAAIAQVDSFTPALVDIGDTFTLTCNGRSVTFTATAATVANVTAGLTALWKASTQGEHAELTAADCTTYLTLTADTAGKPFTVTSSSVGGTLTRAAVTANQGPNVWAAGNFSSGALPVDGDSVIFEDSSIDCLYDLDQNAVDLAALTVKQSYSGNIGLPRTSDAGYVEYREQNLKINNAAAGAITIKIGEGEGSGSNRIKLNTGAGQTNLYIYNGGTRLETGIPSVLWQGTHASNVVTLQKGDLGVAIHGGETATIATLNVGYIDSQPTDATLFCSSGVTLTTVNVYGGTIELNSAVTTLTQNGGEVTFRGSGTVTTWNCDAGTINYQSSGTATTIVIGGRTVLDFTQDLQSRTVTNCSAYLGAEIHDPFKTVTWTNGVDLVRRSMLAEDGVIDLGRHLTVTPSAI